jgi:hypothetical protein
VYDIAGSACILRHPWPPRLIILLQAFGGRLWHIVYIVVRALRCQPEGLRLHHRHHTYAHERRPLSLAYD